MLLLLLTCLVALGQAPEPEPIVIQDISEPITIDGHLDEESYTLPPLGFELVRFQPNQGGPPPGTTEYWLFQDEKSLYFTARISDISYKVRSHITPRERINFDDQIGLYLSTFGDPREGYLFYFNPLGVQQDIRMAPNSFSFAWDTQMKSKGRVTEDGYIIEVEIPFRSIKYPKANGTQEWRAFVLRKVPSIGATFSYPMIERRHPRLFSLAAPLNNVRPGPGGSGLELIPSFTAFQAASREALSEPLVYTGVSPWTEAFRPALDARFGFTPNLGLTATINPDFSQIEGDQTYIDLNQRFAFFLRERRPFFLDGNEYFSDVSESFYSRSIQDPLHGLKVSGREGPVALGVLHLLDKSPNPTVHDDDTPGFNEDDVEGRIALNHIARSRIDAFNGGAVGFTAIDKRILDPQGLKPVGQHTGALLDITVPTANDGQFMAATYQSWTGRNGEGLMWGQENYINYLRYQRRGLGGNIELTDRSLGLRKEMGFVNQSGLTAGTGEVYYAWEPGGAINRYVLGVETEGQIERNGDGFQSVTLDQRLVHDGIHEWSASFGLLRTTEEDVQDLGWLAEVEYEAEWAHFIEMEATAVVARLLDYGRLEPAYIARSNVYLTLRPTAGLSWENNLFYERIFPRNDETSFATRWRSKLNWQFSRELGLRTIVEHTGGSALDPTLRSSILLSWLLNPGTAAYLGYSETTQLGEDIGGLERAVFGKVSVYWRP